MVTFAQLRDLKADEIAHASQAWIRLSRALKDADDGYGSRVLAPARASGWNGESSEVAFAQLTPAQRLIQVAVTETASIASLLDTAHAALKAAQNELHAAISEANSLGLTVNDRGVITIPPVLAADDRNAAARADAQQLRARGVDISRRFTAALKKAAEADGKIAAALSKQDPNVMNDPHAISKSSLNAQLATQLAGFNPKQIPPANIVNGGPKAISDWWKSLTPEQRQLMMAAYPGNIGGLNGIPTTDRNVANRTYLDDRITALNAIPPKQRSALENKNLMALTKLENDLNTEAVGTLYVDSNGITHGHPPVEMNLLGVQEFSDAHPAGGGIVAFGNPDTAKHTGIWVGGTTTDVNDIGFGPAGKLYRQTNELAPGQVATVAWLGYNAPQWDFSHNPASDAFAQAGAPHLNQFVDGLRQAQADAGNNGTITAVGHSYGTTVIGAAARTGNLHVNDIVFAGSPGADVNRAADLGIGPNHVWSERAPGDPVPDTGYVPGSHSGDYTVHNQGHYSGEGIKSIPGDSLFGGNVMTTTGTDGYGILAHTHYFDDGTDSLQNQAKVIVQRYGDVHLKPQ